MAFSDPSDDPASSAGSEADRNAEAIFAKHLALQAAQGDLAATHALLRHITPTLRRVVAGVLGRTHGDVDDVLQQALIAVQRALPAFRGECHVAGYSSRIALRVALRARRRHKLELFRREVLARLEDDTSHGEPPSAEAEAERRRQVLRNLLEELPEEQADVLALRIMLGLSLEEVAQATGAPLNTVRSRVRLAKEALRKRIESTPELADLRVIR
jgi:RNA polymerase sigma factor (sigma-70 family)